MVLGSGLCDRLPIAVLLRGCPPSYRDCDRGADHHIDSGKAQLASVSPVLVADDALTFAPQVDGLLPAGEGADGVRCCSRTKQYLIATSREERHRFVEISRSSFTCSSSLFSRSISAAHPIVPLTWERILLEPMGFFRSCAQATRLDAWLARAPLSSCLTASSLISRGILAPSCLPPYLTDQNVVSNLPADSFYDGSNALT
jgi:hypothetical protein